MTTSVLYDAPGPRAKRRALLGSAIAAVLFALLAVVVVRRLADNGQFEAEKWRPLFDPSHERFDQVWTFLYGGLKNTLMAAAFAMVLSLVIGTFLATTRIMSARSYRWFIVGLIELLRGIPVVMLIFFAARVLPEYGMDFDTIWYIVIGLTAYNAVVIAEIVRAGVASLPRGQSEAAYAVGLTRGQTMRLVLLPQAFRVMLPALISQLVVVLKDTSLGFIISYEELLRRGLLAVQNLRNPIQTLLVVGLIFIAINYALSKLAEWVERRLSRAGKTAGPGPQNLLTTQEDDTSITKRLPAQSGLSGGG